MEFRYEAVLNVQADGGKRLVSFSAPATDIGSWGGVPQKKSFDDSETAGFQREENNKRVASMATFLKDARNTLQNPLLCSERDAEGCRVSFVSLEGHGGLGHVVVTMPDLDRLPLSDVFGRVQAYLETRLPSLKGQKPSDRGVSRVTLLAREEGLMSGDQVDGEEERSDGDVEDGPEVEGEELAGDQSTAVLFEDSHIADFWEEIAARRVVLEKLGPDYANPGFLGFSREALESYIKPIVVMDGQHRLRGALVAAEASMNSPAVLDAIEARVNAGETADEVSTSILRERSRRLSVSLLLDPNPAEHVFQFVVVNQKATPIGRALLGTIVSTSLSDDELGDVAERLQAAGIPLDESRAASFMARRPPFAGLVDLGMRSGSKNELLPWPVMVSLVQIFRDLEGANLYHQRKSDWAKAWARECLDGSPIVSDFLAKGFDDPKAYWRSFDGPWRGVFITFFSYIRDHLGSLTATDQNYWGNPRTSNLFNKPSLHILAADFFRFLGTFDVHLRDEAHVLEEARKWLAKVDPKYFEKDWKLDRAGVKKDSSGIRYAWAKIWDEYRTNPARLPRIENYSKPSMV